MLDHSVKGGASQPWQSLRFPQIEGLRFVAALLVAIYHIWTNRISGGVDVFFAVSGLLIALSLLRQVEAGGRLDLMAFFSGLALRLLPASLVVLILVQVGAIAVLPATHRLDTAREVLASMLYVENWQLARKAVDYLDRENIASPVQHFWAMSVQGQFYLYAAILFAIAVALRRYSVSMARLLLGLNASAVALSFGYSVYQTYYGDQQWAYFDTFARIWEFGLGVMAALAVMRNPRLSLPVAFGWFGLIAIVLCGIIFNVGTVFPGAAALLPVAAAILVVFGGQGSSKWSVSRILGSPVLVSLGSISYGFYLFHWPLLVFYQHASGVRPGALGGATIILVSILLAYATRFWIEAPALAVKAAKDRGFKLRLIALTLVPILTVTAGSYAAQRYMNGRELRREAELQVKASAIPALRLATLPTTALVSRPERYIPLPAAAKQDRPNYYRQNCNVPSASTDIKWCTFGLKSGFARTIAMVGGSHTEHWLPALELIAAKHRWRILLTAWGGCTFMVDAGTERCRTLSRTAMQELPGLHPDIVFTVASLATQANPDDSLATWKELERLGIPVIAVRGTPRHRQNVPDCLAAGGDYRRCGSLRKRAVAAKFDTSHVPANATVFDLTDYFCGKNVCPATSDGVIMYKDRHHITTTFMKKLTGKIEKHLVPAMEKAVSASRSANGTMPLH